MSAAEFDFAAWLRENPRGLREHRPLADFLECEFLEAEASPGYAKVLMASSDHFRNIDGRVSGGLVCTMLDEVMGFAGALAVTPALFGHTLDIAVRFLRPVPQGLLTVEGRVIRRTSRILFLEGELTAAGGDVCARASATATYRSPPDAEAPAQTARAEPAVTAS